MSIAPRLPHVPSMRPILPLLRPLWLWLNYTIIV